MLWSQSATQVYTRAENKLQSISKLFIPQVITPQVSFLKTELKFYPQFQNVNQENKNNNTYFGAYLDSVGTQHRNLHREGWTFLFCGPTQEQELATVNTGKTREMFWKNACEWTARVEISKEDIPGSNHSMNGCILTYYRLERENLYALCSQHVGL